MSRSRTKKYNSDFFNIGKGKKRFLAITFEILHSKSWKSLSKFAQLSYINIVACYDGTNEKEIVCRRKNLVCPIHASKWLIGTKELEVAGFIHVIRRNGINGSPNFYALTNDWKKKERNGDVETEIYERLVKESKQGKSKNKFSLKFVKKQQGCGKL